MHTEDTDARVHVHTHTLARTLLSHGEQNRLEKALLTMLQVKHLHSVDKVRAGVEIVGPWLLQTTQAKDTAFSHGTASKSSAAGQAWVSGPCAGLQIKSFKSSHGELALAASCQRK